MADAVSKLYAEIGFKVKKDELDKVKAEIQHLANVLSSLNNTTKNAAKEYGIFSKSQMKQDLESAKIATEASKKALYDKRTQILGLKRLDEVEAKAKKEKLAEEKKQAKEQKEAEKRQSEEAEANARRTNQRIKGIISSLKSFGRDVKKTFERISGTGLSRLMDEVGQSVGRSISTRNFMMATGMSLNEIQKITHKFANVGSSMSQEQIMEDINKMSQGLVDISLAKGDVSTYKLMGAAAKRGDIAGQVRIIGQALQGLDPAMALNMIRSLGGRDDWLQYYKSPQRYGGQWVGLSNPQQKGLESAQTALVQLRRSFIDLADQIASAVSPIMRSLADGLRNFYQKLASWIKEKNFEKFTEALAKVIESFNAWLDNLTAKDINQAWDDFKKWISEKTQGFKEDMDVILDGMHGLANLLRRFGFGNSSQEKSQPVRTGNVIEDYNLARKYMGSQTMTFIDNKTINTQISGVEQDKIPETAKQVTEVAQTPLFDINKDMFLSPVYEAGRFGFNNGNS